jgi:23S rRNA pseudouridine1911/1915/1917 synthase
LTAPKQSWKSPTDALATPIDRFLRERLENVSWNHCRRLVGEGKVSINGVTTRLPTVLVQPGDDVCLGAARSASGPQRRETLCTLVHLDSQVVVVDKPSGLSTVPYDDSEQDTVWHQVRTLLRARFRSSRAQVLVVHRIDKETSGLVVFARTNAAFRHLKGLFRVHAIERRYVALVHGRIADRTIRSRLVADRGDGRRGSTQNPLLGRDSVTHVRVLEHFDGATLVECRLETGRTHQIRIHLSEAGHPLLGERVYAHGSQGDPVSNRVMLHAHDLGFVHPTSGQTCHWTAATPEDMNRLISLLRGS